ncbi:MFS transporter [Parafilimonas sp.]|uniref:MFS transporter n=1 Tax=Parafilimonas sp. TaxID=1969739 RepID=UPI0039E374B2
MYNKGLFQDWVPKPVMVLLYFLILLILLATNPVYSPNIGLMVSSTGIITEYFTWATFAGTIGMGVAIPLIMRLKIRFRAKELMLASLLTMAVLSIVIATATSPEVIVAASFLFGFMKMFGMVEVVLPIRGILSPKGDNGTFYAKFYPIAIGTGQLCSPYIARFAQAGNWQMLHHYSAALFLFTALLCIVVMHNLRFAPKMPLKGLDWPAIVLFATPLMCFSYVVIFGKQQDWFHSPNIRYATLAMIVTAVCLVARELMIKSPLLMFKIYRLGSVRTGLLLLIGQGIFMGASSIQSIYTTAILGYNWIHNASLSLMMLPGIMVAGLVAFHWTKNKIPLKMYIFSCFGAYIIYFTMLYLMMVPGLNIEGFLLPQLFNGYGMGGLFISLWVYTLSKVPQEQMLYSVAPVMVFRSIICTAFFTGFFNWAQYALQVQSVNNLAFYFYMNTISLDATVGNFGTVQLGAVLAANKKLLGYVIIAGLAFLAFIFFHQFGNYQDRIDHNRELWAQWKNRKKKQVVQQGTEANALSEGIGGIAGSL